MAIWGFVRLVARKFAKLQVEVKDGETGLWLVKPLNGKLYVEGIPPFFSTSAARMLIPAQVR